MQRSSKAQIVILVGTLSGLFVGCGTVDEANSEVVDIRTDYVDYQEDEISYKASGTSSLPSRVVTTGTAEFRLPEVDMDIASIEVSLKETNCQRVCQSYEWSFTAKGGETIRLPNVMPAKYFVSVTMVALNSDAESVESEGTIIVVREATTSTVIAQID